MDFTLSEEQQEIRDLATRIFEERAAVERVREVEASADRFDRDLWAELAKANLLGISLPEEWGGSGFGVVETSLLLEQQGRRVAPIPLLGTLVSAQAIAAHGSPAQQSRWLPAVVSGDSVLSPALTEDGANEPYLPSTAAVRDEGGWRLEGVKRCVPYGHVAERFLVPARTEAGVEVFLVDPTAPGVETERAETTAHEPEIHLLLAGVRVGSDAVIGGSRAGGAPAGGQVVRTLLERSLVGLSAIQVGVAEEALRMAAEHTSQREQFGRPLATNQGVALRAADAYIDVEAMRATMWQAAWRLDAGLDATREAMVAKWWASDAGQRVVHTTQHLHGGLGSDVDYPVHRYFLWGKQIELTLGAPSYQLARLGRVLAGDVRR